MSEYLGWEELLQEPPAPEVGVPGDPELSSRLAVLMRERAQLEARLQKLLGHAPPDAEEAREQALFPMPIHTAESRMEDRRRAREEERAQAAARRVMERTRLRAEEERRHQERQREREREAIQQQVLEAAEAERRGEREEARLRRRLADELIRERWAAQREAARLAREETRLQEWLIFEERILREREKAMQRCTAQRSEEAEFHRLRDLSTERLARRREIRRKEGFGPLGTDG